MFSGLVRGRDRGNGHAVGGQDAAGADALDGCPCGRLFDITVIKIFFLGALFFCVAALSRRIVVVYLQGVAVLALYLILAISVIATNRLDRFWPSVVDPMGLDS